MMFGVFIAFLTLVFYGPSEIFGLPEDWRYMLVGLTLMGWAITFCLIPALPEMIRTVENDFDNSKGEVNDVASGIFNTALGIGQVSGPLIGSFMTHQIGFRSTTDLLSIYAIVFGTIYFIFGGGVQSILNVFKSAKQIEEEQQKLLSAYGSKSIEIEMAPSLMYKSPINDYFNRSLSDVSVYSMKRSVRSGIY